MATVAVHATIVEELGLVNVHPRGKCAGESCAIHNPSDHKMRSWKPMFESRMGILYRICPHGQCHPDPDSVAWLSSLGYDEYLELHGPFCDECP